MVISATTNLFGQEARLAAAIRNRAQQEAEAQRKLDAKAQEVGLERSLEQRKAQISHEVAAARKAQAAENRATNMAAKNARGTIHEVA